MFCLVRLIHVTMSLITVAHASDCFCLSYSAIVNFISFHFSCFENDASVIEYNEATVSYSYFVYMWLETPAAISIVI